MTPITDDKQTVAVQRPAFWKLADDYEFLIESLAYWDSQLSGAMPDEERAPLVANRARDAAALEAIGMELAAKADALAGVVRRLESDRDELKAGEQRLHGKRKQVEAAIDSLKGYVMRVMVDHQQSRIKTATTTVAIRGNGGLAQLTVRLEDLDPAYLVMLVRMSAADYSEAAIQFPDMVLVGKEPNNAAIREALAGVCPACGGLPAHEVADACGACGGDGKARINGAKLEARGMHLRIE